MLAIERQSRLLELLRDSGAASLEDLAKQLDVSTSTVRRDVEALEKRGGVKRTHGGAVYTGEPKAADAANAMVGGVQSSLAARMAENTEAKRAIGRYAASLVEPNMTVMMDGGSTVVIAAEYITARPIQVVTNSISIAQLYKDDDQIELALTGGTLYPRSEVTTGSITRGTLAELNADLLFLSLAGIYGDDVYNINMAMARVEQVMMQQATRSVLLMDSSKFGRRSLARVASLGEFDEIVTDAGISDEWRERLGERLVVAD